MNLTSYADLAVRLVNTAIYADDEPDRIGSPETFRAFAVDFASVAGPVTGYDLEALRQLRAELCLVFAAAASGAQQTAGDRLNALLIQHPVHPELVRHDSECWHLHLAPTGSVTGRYAAAAVFGLTMFAAQFGVERMGLCAIASCPRAFIDASASGPRRYCGEHSATRTNVMPIEPGRRTGSGGPAAHAAS
ncbi:MAG: CGNR zinc finger domain-containing protein [Streptosporangiaceae bacterium]